MTLRRAPVYPQAYIPQVYHFHVDAIYRNLQLFILTTNQPGEWLKKEWDIFQ